MELLKIKQMFKREQLMVIAAVAAVVIGGVYHFAGALKKNSALYDPRRAVEIQSFIGEETAKNIREMPSASDLYIVRHAGTRWVRNPFSYTVENVSKKKSHVRTIASQKPGFVYTGYMDTGKRKVAIIDGIEYLVGDPMEKKDFFVKSITSSRVLVKNRKDKSEYKIPLSE